MTAPQWTAERAVTPARVQELLRATVPGLARLPLTVLGEGWDNTVLLAGQEWTLRFPRRAVALPGIRREIAVLPAIAPRLPLAVPVPQIVAADLDPEDPWPFTGARLIAGRELAGSGLPDAAREPVAAAVGAFLRVLHAPATREAVPADADLPLDPLHRGWPRARLSSVQDTLRRLGEAEVWAGDQAVDELLAEAAQLPAPAGAPVLVHGDLHVRHVLVDEAGAATGVIDWGDLCLADPAVDLGFAYAAFSGVARAALLAAYGYVGPDRELRARALAVRLSALLADYAARDGRPALLDEALGGLRRAVS